MENKQIEYVITYKHSNNILGVIKLNELGNKILIDGYKKYAEEINETDYNIKDIEIYEGSMNDHGDITFGAKITYDI